MRCTWLSVSSLYVLTALAGGCSGDDSDEANGGLSPILDGTSDWKRIKSIAPQGPFGIGTSMSMNALTRIGGTFTILDKEVRGSQGGDLTDRYAVTFAPGEDIASAHVNLGEASDQGDYRFVFAPGTTDVYESFREPNGSETWSGLRTNGMTVSSLRSPGGGYFAGLADLYDDGSALIPGTDMNSALLRNGEWTRIYGRYSDINEPQTFTSYPVQLADQSLVWALLRETEIAIGTVVLNPMRADQPQVKGVASIPPPEGYIAQTCYARPFGNQIVFLSATKLNDDTTLSVHRWTQGATTIETLYSNVQLPTNMRLPPITNDTEHLLLLDADGQLTYFADQQTGGTALIRVDASGPHIVSMIPAGGYLVQGPWLIDGTLYAGIGASEGRDVTQLDLVALAK